MAAFFVFYDPYRDVGGDIGATGDFEQGLSVDRGTESAARWEVHGESARWEPRGGFASSGGVRLGSQEGSGSSITFTLDDPGRFRFLRLAGRLRTEGIVLGEDPWNTARLMLLFSDRTGRRHTEYRPLICSISGTRDWQSCERVFEVPDFAATAVIVAENEAASGTLWVDDVRLTPAVEKPSTVIWRAFFATLWCAVLLYCVWLSRLPRKALGVAAIAVALVIIAGVAVPESAVERILNRGAYVAKGLAKGQFLSLDKLAGPIAGSPESAHPGVSTFVPPRPLTSERVHVAKKAGHFLLFGVLAFVSFYSVARSRARGSSAASPAADLPTIGLALVVFAAGTEVLQFLSVSRGPSLVDWAIDTGGILVGAGCALFARRFAARRVASDPIR